MTVDESLCGNLKTFFSFYKLLSQGCLAAAHSPNMPNALGDHINCTRYDSLQIYPGKHQSSQHPLKRTHLSPSGETQQRSLPVLSVGNFTSRSGP
eukprot:s1597_g16.t1